MIGWWVGYIKLERRDPRYSVFLDGDELAVAQVTSPEAVEAVKRLFHPTEVMFWPRTIGERP